MPYEKMHCPHSIGATGCPVLPGVHDSARDECCRLRLHEDVPHWTVRDV